ncbi:MAG: hypothetical protein WCS56_00140 [Bacilli bacterium]
MSFRDLSLAELIHDRWQKEKLTDKVNGINDLGGSDSLAVGLIQSLEDLDWSWGVNIKTAMSVFAVVKLMASDEYKLVSQHVCQGMVNILINLIEMRAIPLGILDTDNEEEFEDEEDYYNFTTMEQAQIDLAQAALDLDKVNEDLARAKEDVLKADERLINTLNEMVKSLDTLGDMLYENSDSFGKIIISDLLSQLPESWKEHIKLLDLVCTKYASFVENVVNGENILFILWSEQYRMAHIFSDMCSDLFVNSSFDVKLVSNWIENAHEIYNDSSKASSTDLSVVINQLGFPDICTNIKCERVDKSG